MKGNPNSDQNRKQRWEEEEGLPGSDDMHHIILGSVSDSGYGEETWQRSRIH